MLPSVDIIIVNWNSDNLLSECIRSINNAVQNNFILNKVVVVDNASSDNSLDLLDSNNLPLVIIKNSQNLGFAKACNQGADKSNADYLLFLNPDTRLFSNSLSVPIDFMNKKENKNIGIVGIQLKDENNIACRNCARFPSTLRMAYMSFGLDRAFPKYFKPHFMIEWDHLDSKFVDQVMGSFFMIRRELFEILGGYDERFFIYYEDLDLSYRVKQIGIQSFYLAEASIYHKGGGTSDKIKTLRLFYILRSKLLYAKKHFNTSGYFLAVLFTFIPEALIRILSLIIKGKIKSSGEVIAAYNMLIKSLIK